MSEDYYYLNGQSSASVPKPPENAGLFPPETGPVYVDGKHFRHPDGRLAQVRDVSCFLLYLRFKRGEDITPTLKDIRANGFNCVRLFGLLPSPPWDLPDYSRPEHFDWVAFDLFLSLMELFGIWVNFSIAHQPGNWKDFHGRLLEMARTHWCLTFLEHVNEPDVQSKPDPIRDFLPYNPNDKWVPPTAYGYYEELLDKYPETMPKTARFGTVHTPRDSSWYRRFRIAQEGQDEMNKPWWNQEHAKITEQNFHYVGGKNDPQTTPRETAWYAGGCYLWCSAYTYHCEEGKWGRFPKPGQLQYEVMENVRDTVFKKIDASWQVGKYNGSHMSSSPVDDVDYQGSPVWTYSSYHPEQNKALSIRFGPVPLKAINGWRIVDAWGPKNAPGTFAILTR